MKTAVVLDFSVFCHQLHGIMDEHLKSEHFLGIAKAQLLWLQSGEWLGECKPEQFQMIMVTDNKPYWRTEYLKRSDVVVRVPRRTKADKARVEKLKALLAKPFEEVSLEEATEMAELSEELALHYKAGRKFPEYTFTKLKKHLLDISATQGWNVLAESNYEADDLAATIVKLNRELPERHQNHIILATVDTDWLGLLDDKTIWFCTHGWYPRVRDRRGFDHWSFKKFGVTFDEPREIWDYKAVHGDKSDNLPPGSPLEVIDLHQPPEGFRLWDKPAVRKQVTDLLTSGANYAKHNQLDAAKKYLQNLGVPLAIRPYASDIDHIPLAA